MLIEIVIPKQQCGGSRLSVGCSCAIVVQTMSFYRSEDGAQRWGLVPKYQSFMANLAVDFDNIYLVRWSDGELWLDVDWTENGKMVCAKIEVVSVKEVSSFPSLLS